jgi:triacylglycerol lipase
MSLDNRFPIVLAHGIARFDALHELLKNHLHLPDSQQDDELQYFKGIKTHLERHGFTVYRTDVDFAGRVELRAEQLADQINNLLRDQTFKKVHIIAHSMGGLDARHMIVDLSGMAEKVATLTTIGTPHLGTSLADRVLGFGGKFIIRALDAVIHLDGFEDLTIEACTEFNRRAEPLEAANSVVYQTYAGAQPRSEVFFLLKLSWDLINLAEGANDGLVPLTSQQWHRNLIAPNGTSKIVKQVAFQVPVDHLNEVGWWDPSEGIVVQGLIHSIEQVTNYERQIKDIYLSIAQDAGEIPAQ